MSEPDIDAILRGGSSRRRWLMIFVAALLVAAAAVAAFLLTRTDETDVVVELQQVEATLGRLTTEVELSGSAVSERSATLSFDVSGVVSSVAVTKSDEVREGATLATLRDADAQRRVETAEVQLRLAQLRLDELLADPEQSVIASAGQAIVSAKSQVLSAELALEELSEPPGAADLASAEQAVAAAIRDIASAERALALLSEPPSAADLASAEQAVVAALAQISSAEQALDMLSEPPSSGDLRSAEQAVATALSQISSAERDLADLLAAGPTEAQLAQARSDVTQAQVLLSATATLAAELMEALIEDYDAFCDRYSGIARTYSVIRETCAAALPLTDAEVNSLRDSFEDRSDTYESLGTALIDANVGLVAAAADRDSAHSALATAEETLSDMLQPVSEDDVHQAEQDLAAAQASHAAAVARLDDLRATADAGEVSRAQRELDAARASHAAAVARLDDLQIEADEGDLYQAQQALEAARAGHTTAVARLEELRAATDEGDVEQAQAALETAQASLASAQAQYDNLVVGPAENAIEQQRQDVRLAEISLEEARTALSDLTIVAPFGGIVEDVNIHPGDSIAAGSPAFTLSTSNDMLVLLTVTEEELLELEVGQTGMASFAAIDGIDYPVRVESITRVPEAEQGVVTYDVEARILAASELADAAAQGPAGAFRPGAGTFGGGPGGGFGGGPGGPLAGVQLPEGVTPQQVRQAIISGGPLPEGVVLPEEVIQMVERIRAAGGLAQGAGGQQGAAQQPGDVSARPLPAPGMSASVTILTEVREESVLAPISAVRQLDGQWFVSIPAAAAEGEAADFQRVFVEVGASDGENVEISNGLDAGAILLIGADNAGVAFTATLQQTGANQGFGFGPPGGFGPGGGGGRP